MIKLVLLLLVAGVVTAQNSKFELPFSVLKPKSLYPVLTTPIRPLPCKDCDAKCPTKDCIIYNLMQTPCTEVTKPRSLECRWPYYGLASHTDQEVLGGRIVAYKIRWFNGNWSGWYVPGVNDMDCKFNKYINTRCKPKHKCMNSLRRMWSYFYDHTHKYIICKP